MPRVDLVGQRFGKLTVVEIAPKRIERFPKTRWLCRCDCGAEVVVAAGNLLIGKTKSCGCLSVALARQKLKDLTGKCFGKLKVVNRAEHSSPMAHWNCLCECGNGCVVSGASLRNGDTKSCGCLRKQTLYDLTGDRPRWQTKNGYVVVHYPEHPNASKGHQVYEHVLVMSELLGRPLERSEHVHHKNGIRNDNKSENLELWSSQHPAGQRIEDLINFAIEILGKYAPDRLNSGGSAQS